MAQSTSSREEDCIKEIARWFGEHRRNLTLDELRAIVQKHFTLEEVDDFYEFIKTADGHHLVEKWIGYEAWRAGIAEPPPRRTFPMGQIVMTRGLADRIDRDEEFAKFVSESLARHARGDWGELDPEDKKANEEALRYGGRLFSAYEKWPLPKVWVITESDRSATTILFPEEY